MSDRPPIRYGWPGLWDQHLATDRNVSHRSTRTSRKPGAKVEGTIYSDRRVLEPCPDCGVLTYVSIHPHGVRWVTINGVHQKVDCLFRPITK